ncbi:hypothetical protein ACFSFZ_01130 [Mixta tenebrionis]|uniref:Uncharacterized protein n=1 Tax=Mixta tenebrionis TaxID=2562439 RepID=A0A506V974_9GAMM|nr:MULTISPECIES: hypothetical protein [Mixta]QHM77188.1 hypothetical protein C7M52_03184 [Mixta theicola]TPW42086.1 hypothetical protein FKM52_12080 [Mixta tenebrionis]
MNKIMLIGSLVLFISGYVMAAEPAGGNVTDIEAAGGANFSADKRALADFLPAPTSTDAALAGNLSQRFH